ncbi:sigma-70 family RNA polymerase sigma factor [bacterium]|nr:sigma-70 family RNA polymerase sigma factor [bacterium]
MRPIQRYQQEARQRCLEDLLSQSVYDCAWRYCCLLAANRQDAEDLLHDSLVLALQRLDQLRDDAGFRGWLLSIIRSRFLNTRRSRQSEQRREEQLAWVAAAALDDPRCAELAAALRALPRQQRLELSLFYLEGLSQQECAQALGISLAALQARLHRGRAALREQLAKGQPAGAVAPASEECHV